VNNIHQILIITDIAGIFKNQYEYDLNFILAVGAALCSIGDPNHSVPGLHF
jgi:hypothetical protein